MDPNKEKDGMHNDGDQIYPYNYTALITDKLDYLNLNMQINKYYKLENRNYMVKVLYNQLLDKIMLPSTFYRYKTLLDENDSEENVMYYINAIYNPVTHILKSFTPMRSIIENIKKRQIKK